MSTKLIPAVRIKISTAQPADPLDPREFIGFHEDLAPAELWERGRAAWRLRAEKVLACDLLIIAHAGIVRMVGTVTGVYKYEGRGERLAIDGVPIPDHPLIGQADPLDNASRNPIAYGTITLEEQNG